MFLLANTSKTLIFIGQSVLKKACGVLKSFCACITIHILWSYQQKFSVESLIKQTHVRMINYIPVLLYWSELNYIDLHIHNIIHIYSGITSGRVLNGELLYTKILEVNLFAFVNKLTSRIFVDLHIHVE